MATLPLANHPGRIAVNIGAQLVSLELATRIFLGRCVRVNVKGIVDARLPRPANHNCACIYSDFDVFGRGQRPCKDLAPNAVLAAYVRFLRHGKGRKYGQYAEQADELWRTFQNNVPRYFLYR